MKIPSPKHQVAQALQKILCIGESKYKAKKNGDAAGIYSWSTYNNYLQVGTQFLKWARSEYGVRILDDALGYVEPYIQKRIADGCSASTIKRDVSALCKLYDLPRDCIEVELPKRHRANITRSRTAKKHDKEFSEENNKDAVLFGKGTGLRKHELKKVKGRDVFCRDREVYIRTKGKGGRVRTLLVLPKYREHILACAGRVRANELIFAPGTIKNRMDEHSYRREYAQELYKLIARPTNSLSKEDKYYCRCDKKGMVYDRAAMKTVSENLGHSRINVIAQSYL